MLTFVIPTRERPAKLEVAVRSIAEQIPPFAPVFIKIIAHNAADETLAVCNRLKEMFPDIVSWRYHTARPDYSDAFRAMFTEASDSDWVWTFGDDDKLLPGALTFMLEELRKPEVADIQYFHVAETTRWGKTGTAFRGTLWDLVNQIGLVDLTGFISGNIIRGDRLAHAVETPRWNKYALSSYVQSLALLEEFMHDQCAFLDIALLENQENVTAPSEEAMRLWVEQNIPGRYQFVVDGMEAMYDVGLPPGPVRAIFWRYLSYTLFNRIITHWLSDLVNMGRAPTPSEFARLEKMAMFVEDGDEKDKMIEDINIFSSLAYTYQVWVQHINLIRNQLGKLLESRNVFPHPYSYVEPAPSPTPAGEGGVAGPDDGQPPLAPEGQVQPGELGPVSGDAGVAAGGIQK